jgi:HK97 family phage portal protein
LIGRGLITRARALVTRLRSTGEGEVRPGPWFLPKTGGWLSAEAGQYWNWWQMGYDVEAAGANSAIVQACVSAYSQTIAMCPGDHWIATPLGGRERVTTSALSRILRKPNEYQSISDFLLNLTWQLYATGNAYCLAFRNDRFEADELHLMSSSLSKPLVAEEGSLFYRLGGNAVIDHMVGSNQLTVPARDVLHIKLNAPQGRAPWPLLGETPLAAIYGDLAMQRSMQESQGSFYANQARPSAVLSTDLILDRVQVEELRQRWDEQSRGLKAGGTPILTAGLKVNPWATSSRDAQMVELLKISDERIALAFRIPLQILGMGGGSPAGSTEALMRQWVSSGLGFALNHIEEGFGQFFRLDGQPKEYVEFSTESLLRSEFKNRIEGLVRGVQGGIFSPNDARNQEGLDRVPFGDDVRVQAQNVPLSAASEIPSAPAAPSAPAPGPATPESDTGADDESQAQLATDFFTNRDVEINGARAVA